MTVTVLRGGAGARGNGRGYEAQRLDGGHGLLAWSTQQGSARPGG
jgi:hypothetical protein